MWLFSSSGNRAYPNATIPVAPRTTQCAAGPTPGNGLRNRSTTSSYVGSGSSGSSTR